MQIEYNGYHGTSSDEVSKIEQDGFIPSGPLHWLGEGVYFYDNSFNSAVKFAGWKNPAVYEARIVSNINKVLDLFSDEGKELLVYIADWLEKTSEENQYRGRDKLIGALFYIVHSDDFKGEFEVIRGPYSKPFPQGYNSSAILGAEIHLCVKELRCIESFRRVL